MVGKVPEVEVRMTLKIEVVEGKDTWSSDVGLVVVVVGAGFVGFPHQFVQSQSINYQSEVVFQIHFRGKSD